jgi:hypothetical protein
VNILDKMKRRGTIFEAVREEDEEESDAEEENNIQKMM